MPTNPNWPLTATQFSTSVPFDGSTPSFVDISARVRDMRVSYGRQYELDVIQAGVASLTIDDKDEAFNPTNPNSPYYPNVKLYRQVIDQTMWPSVPSGGAVNLLNATSGYDPSFDSYGASSTPSWISAVGSTSPTVSTTSPQQGTCCLTWTVAGTAVVQGASFKVSCIPGQQYIASGYVSQTSASTQQIQILTTTGSITATGASTAVTGSYVRLAAAFTATQPVHVVQFATTGTAVAGTVRLDAVQVEPVAPLNSNSGFESGGLAGWTPNNSTGAVSTVWWRDGQYSASLTASGAGTASIESSGVSVTAGQQYCAGGWLYSPGGYTPPGGSFNTVSINWFDANFTYLSTSSSPGVTLNAGQAAYASATFTAPANAARATVLAGLGGTPTAGTVFYVDLVTLTSATPSAFSTTGPAIYGTFSGYVERWPSSWLYRGTFGQARITVVDALAILSNRSMRTEYPSTVFAKKPSYYWPLNEANTATSFGERSGNNGPPLTRLDNAFGVGPTFSAGTATNIPGDPSGTGLACDTGTVTTNAPGSVAQAGTRGSDPSLAFTVPPPGGGTTGYTVAFWASHATLTNTGATKRQYLLNVGNRVNVGQLIQVSGLDSPNNLNFLVSSLGSPAAYQNVTVTDLWADGKPHLFVISMTIQPTSYQASVYVDGVLAATPFSSSTSGFTAPATMGLIQVGGRRDPQTGAGELAAPGGVYSHVALWARPLSSSEVADLRTAGGGYVNEASGARITRYLSYGWTGPTAIDNGMSTMGVSTVTDKSSLLSGCQNVALTENGRFWVDGNGVLTFQSRKAQYQNTTPKWVFGEQELPYEENIQFDYDSTLIQNDVRVTQAGGIETTGGSQAAITASVNAYGTHTYTRTVNTASVNEAQDAANWIFAGHSDPHQRVASLTINPAANPALWPVALGARIGDRVTVKRRTAAGYTMSGDYFLERIEHNRGPSTWTTTFQMSPPFNTQAWILQDPTYGALDTSTILAY